MHHVPDSLLASNSLQLHLLHSNDPGNFRKQGMVGSHSYIFPGSKFLSPLSDQDGTGLGGLLVENLDTKPAANRVSAVVGGSSGFFGGHPSHTGRRCRCSRYCLWWRLMERVSHCISCPQSCGRRRTVCKCSDHHCAVFEFISIGLLDC